MKPEDNQFLKVFYNAVANRPLEPDDERYVSLYDEALADADPQSLRELPSLPRFFDTHLAFCYRNGHEWYDVHPLIEEQVRRQAATHLGQAA